MPPARSQPLLARIPPATRRGPAVTPSLADVAAAQRYFDWLPDPIFVANDRREYVAINRAGCRIFGLPRRAILGRRLDDFASKEILDRMEEIWARFLRRGWASTEMRYRRRDGHSELYETNSRANFMPGLHLSVLRNVTRHRERLQASARRETRETARRVEAVDALREAEQRYRGVFSRTTSAVVIFDHRDGTVLDANPAAARLYGYRRAAFIGLKLQSTTVDPELFRRSMRRLRRQGTLTSQEFSRDRPNGERVRLSAYARLIRYHGRSAALAVIQDVTARHEAAQALRESERRLRAVGDASLDALYILESIRDGRGRIEDFRIIDANRRGCLLVGRRRSELVGGLVCRLFPFMRPMGLFQECARVVETRRSSVKTFPIAQPAVRAAWIHQHVVPLGDGVAIMARNVSHEKSVEQALRNLSWQTLKGQEVERRRVARDLHDGVGQLLAAVQFRLRVVEADLGGCHRRCRADVSAARRAAVAALQEVRRISQGLRPAELDDLGFGAAVRSMGREFSRRTGVKVRLRLIGWRSVRQTAIEETLYRILQECLTNVERHARAQNVWIDCDRREGRVRLRVRDDGRGFPGRRPGGSTGAGLRNMRERATLAGGTFACRTTPGTGSEIAVELPVTGREPTES